MFEKISLLSKKLNKTIELEGYKNEEGTVIISTNSLKKIFEEIKAEFGITDSYSLETHANPRGQISHVIVNWTLTDDSGYRSTFMGESSTDSLQSQIAKQYPTITALNRAQSAGIIAYLQLPGKMYSDSEIEVKQNSATPARSSYNTTSPVIDVKPVAGTVSAAPQMQEEDVLNTENELPYNTQSAKPVEVPSEAVHEAVYEAVHEAAQPEPTQAKTDDGIELPATQPVEETPRPRDESIGKDTLVGFGKLAYVTIGELLDLYDVGDTFATKFVNLCKNGSIRQSDLKKQQIVEYIKNAV